MSRRLGPTAPSSQSGSGPSTTSAKERQEESRDKHYLVQGGVTWLDGTPVAGVVVRAFHRGLRDERPLGPWAAQTRDKTKTDETGRYTIPYTRGQFASAGEDRADLIVRIIDAEGALVASSPILFKAPPVATIDVVLRGAVAGQPFEYERLVDRITPLLSDLSPPTLTELKPSDIDYLLAQTGADPSAMYALLTSVTLSRDATSGADDVSIAAFDGLIEKDAQWTWTSHAGLCARRGRYP